MISPNRLHTPVLVKEILTLFQPVDGNRLLDATLGHGGHAQAYLEATAPTGHVIGFEADPQAAAQAQANLAAFGSRLQVVSANFANLKDSLIGGGMLHASPSGEPPLFNHILFDLGLGSHQLDSDQRGFSFRSPALVRMAYGSLEKLPPAQLASLNQLEWRLQRLPEVMDILEFMSEPELAELLRFYGEERYAKRIARALQLVTLPVSAQALAQAVVAAVPAHYERGRIHPATRTFQALRLAVNRELEVLTSALPQAVELLSPNGVLAVISFHSLEDRIVKNFLRAHSDTLVTLTKKPTTASAEEIAINPRARSAKLRAAQKR